MAEANPGYRIVRVTGKRQFTVPKAYFERLRLGNKVKCYLEGNRLIIEPINEDLFWDFSTETLQALVAEGYEGENLVREFEARKEKVTRAFSDLVAEARREAEAGQGKPAAAVFQELLRE